MFKQKDDLVVRKRVTEIMKDDSYEQKIETVYEPKDKSLSEDINSIVAGVAAISLAITVPVVGLKIADVVLTQANNNSQCQVK
jgi:hypothetical protein